MIDIRTQFQSLRVIPVVAIDKAQVAMPLADTLLEGGLPCAEITFRTSAAAEAMRILAARGDILVGAGTVLATDQVDIALDAGAKFMVAPGFNPKMAEHCVKKKAALTPGIYTPSDIEAALYLGFQVLNFFPAEAVGGLNTLKAMSAPYQAVEFIPIGGINAQNLAEYLGFATVMACGGTWIAKSGLISKGKFDQILNNAREAVAIAQKTNKSDSC